MPVATQSTKRPDVRVVASDFDADRPISFCGLRAVPDVGGPRIDSDPVCLLVFANRQPRPIAVLQIDATNQVRVTTIGLVEILWLGSLAHLAREVEAAVGCIIRDKRESIYAS